MEMAAPGDILVIDNGGRADEGCVGDLTVAEHAEDRREREDGALLNAR